MMLTVQRDAVVMERLTSSPRIVDIYGHCATSVHVEPVAYEVEEYVVPGSGYMKQKELKDSHDVDPQNDYTATEKLEMALEMAESIAELHGFKVGTSYDKGRARYWHKKEWLFSFFVLSLCISGRNHRSR